MDHSSFSPFALRLAEAARSAIADEAGSADAADNKLNGTGYDPVTEADRAAERAMRAPIEAEYPDHDIAGEEYGLIERGGEYRWSLDPIDGTRAFVCGLPSWTILIGLLHRGAPVLGVIDAPRLGETYVGHAGGAWQNDTPIRTSSCRNLAEARLATTDPHLFDEAELAAFERVRAAARLTRFGWDAYAYARLAAGTIDLVIESGLKPHDYNALIPLVRGAGGVIGDWRGEPVSEEGRVVAAATPELFEAAVRMLGSSQAG